MKKRKQKKYFWLNIPCAHGYGLMAYRGYITNICKISKNKKEECEGLYCKKYKPKYSIKYAKRF